MSSPAVRFYEEPDAVADLRSEVLAGLRRRPKRIAPKFFYDERGSRLFDRICEQPEYYPTRTETGILERHAEEIARLTGPDALLIELGSGASRKVRLLLDALRPQAYLGVDISRDFLRAATERLAADYPWLDVRAACADFTAGLSLPREHEDTPKLAFYPGSSIGNFEPAEAFGFLRGLHRVLAPRGALLVGVDLKKDPGLLHAAYNDAAGITAAFNRNLLHRIRAEMDTDLDPDGFGHYAFYNEPRGRIEMHLVSVAPQSIRVEGEEFRFAPRESIHTECSYKYDVEEFQRLASTAGYLPAAVWTDSERLFSVHYLIPDVP